MNKKKFLNVVNPGLKRLAERYLVTSKEKTLAITSCTSKEGKTSVAVQLAHLLTLKRKKILLIHFSKDRREKNLFVNFGSIDEALLEKSIQKGGLDNPVDCLTVNILSRNKSRMVLNEENSKNFMESLRPVIEKYDLLIIDTIDLNSCPQMIEFIKICDNNILVLKYLKVDKEHLGEAIQNLKIGPCHHLGIIINGVS